MELERIKNLVEIKFNIPDKEGVEGSVTVDSNMLLKDFREKISPVCEIISNTKYFLVRFSAKLQ